MVLVIVGALVVAMLVAAWLVDHRDRRNGRPVLSHRQISANLRSAKKQRRDRRFSPRERRHPEGLVQSDDYVRRMRHERPQH